MRERERKVCAWGERAGKYEGWRKEKEEGERATRKVWLTEWMGTKTREKEEGGQKRMLE